MSGFKFSAKENKLRLEIEGLEMFIDPLSPELIRGISQFRELSLEFSDAFDSKLADNVERLTAAIQGVIASIIGKENYDKTCSGKEFGLMDYIQLGTYIMQSYQVPRIQNIEAFIGDGVKPSEDMESDAPGSSA